jgi:hypothetical protein
MSATDPLFDTSDLDDSRYYCAHGTFIGNPYGADYLCHYCEMGFTDEEYQSELHWRAMRNRNRRIMATLLAQVGSPGTPKRLTDAETSLIVAFIGVTSRTFR